MVRIYKLVHVILTYTYMYVYMCIFILNVMRPIVEVCIREIDRKLRRTNEMNDIFTIPNKVKSLSANER